MLGERMGNEKTPGARESKCGVLEYGPLMVRHCIFSVVPSEISGLLGSFLHWEFGIDLECMSYYPRIMVIFSFSSEQESEAVKKVP